MEPDMPYSVRPRNGKFQVVKDDDGKVMGEFDTRGEARDQMRALYANESDAGKGMLDLSYIKSLHLATLPDVAVKNIGNDQIQGYLVLWGSSDQVDLDTEYFDPNSDFWDAPLKGAQRPLTWDHAQDNSTKSDPVIGAIAETGNDEIGKWYIAQLKRNHQYRRAVDKLIGEKAVGTSSDTAPQYVIREKAKSGAVYLKRWPLFAAALTTTPCEPRMLNSVDWYKSVGLELPSPDASADQVRVMLQKAQRLFSFTNAFGGK
jgi:hypothetical protein